MSDVLTLADLVEKLNEVASKWFEIGICLGVPSGELENIRGRDGTVMYCFLYMIMDWLGNCPEPSKEKIIAALKTDVVGQANLAGRLSNDQRFMSEPLSVQLLLSYLSEAASRWQELGLQLGSRPDVLERFKRSSTNVKAYLTETLLWWLNSRNATGRPRTMQQVLDALCSDVVRANATARDLQRYAGCILVTATPQAE